MKRILIIDDDSFFTDNVQTCARRRWSPEELSFEVLPNEKEFLEAFPSLAENPPDLVIIDEMVPYTTPDDPDLNSLKAKKANSYRRGATFYKILRDDPRTTNIPVVFYTILGQEVVPPGMRYIRKSGSTDMPELMNEISRLVAS